MKPFLWYTGPCCRRSYGVTYGHFTWPSRSELMVPGTWPGDWEDGL